MSTTSGPDRFLVATYAALVAATCLLPAHAQDLYRYRDANGHWVFSDRQPDDGSGFDLLDVDRQAPPGLVRLYRRLPGQAQPPRLAAENSFYGTVQVAFRIVAASNLAANVPLRGNRLLDPRSDTDLFELTPRVPGEPIGLKFEYQYIHGDPGARHQPSEPYRLPYAQASRYRVSQAYPDAVTHADRANLNAVDFEMPVGTNVFAARAGVVIEVATDYYEAGMEERLASRANMIRILHEDGTFALYGHLNWNTIRVVPGQKVTRGEYIADSGNTGFSSGPHLHFVVQRNIGGEVASVPVEFAAAGGGTSTLATGDEPVAY